MSPRVKPQRKGSSGCFAKSCLMLIVLAILLAVVGVGGTFWGVRHTYLADKPVPMPQVSSPGETSPVTPGGTSVSAPPIETGAAVRERLDTMKQAARAHERSEVIFTAADINALIAANRKSRGMASVGIDGNVAQVL